MSSSTPITETKNERLYFHTFFSDETVICPKCQSVVDTYIPVTASGITDWICETCGHAFEEKHEVTPEVVMAWSKKKFKCIYLGKYGKVVMYDEDSSH